MLMPHSNFDINSLNSIDIVIIIVVLISGIAGFSRGLVGSALSIVGWISSFYLTHQLYDSIEPFLIARVGSQFVSFAVGYIGGFLIMLIGFAIVNMTIGSILRSVIPNILDKVFGTLFGWLRGGLICVFIFFCYSIINAIVSDNKIDDPENEPSVVRTAQLYPWLKYGEHLFSKYMPASLHENISKISKKDVADDKNNPKDKTGKISAVDAVSLLSKYASPELLEQVQKMIKQQIENHDYKSENQTQSPESKEKVLQKNNTANSNDTNLNDKQKNLEECDPNQDLAGNCPAESNYESVNKTALTMLLRHYMQQQNEIAESDKLSDSTLENIKKMVDKD